MTPFLQDLRYGARQWMAHREFALAAVLCIALGIGANSATFSYVNAVFLRAPEIEAPDRLVRLFLVYPRGLKFGSFSYPDYVDFRDRSGVFSSLVVETPRPLHLVAGERKERIWGSIVSGNYFSDLGVKPFLGRGFLPEEDRAPGAHAVVVLSYGLWQRRFGADPAVVGKSIVLNGTPFRVVGVAPKRFAGPNVAVAPELWAPMMMQPELMPGRNLLESRATHWIGFTIGRLRPGIGIEQARHAVNAFMAELAKDYPDTNRGISVDLYPEEKARLHPYVRDGFVRILTVLSAAVGFVLLLACANVAGLLLARLAARRKEIGIRLALGASRARLTWQLFSESLVLALTAGGAGILLGGWLVGLTQSFRPPSDLPLRIDVPLDFRVIAFTCLASVLTAVLFGLAPALRATRKDLVAALKDRGDSGLLAGTSRARRLLVVGQIAISFVLLIGAGLSMRSLDNVRHADLGFDPDNLLVATMDLDLQGYDGTARHQFRQALLERVERLPGVRAVGFGNTLPGSLYPQQSSIVPEGYVATTPAEVPGIDYNVVDSGYFAAMGIPVLRGRGFARSDDESSQPVVVVNETFAKRFWPGDAPLGKRIRASEEDLEVVGVVKDGRYSTLGEERKPFVYFSLHRNPPGTTILHVKTFGDPAALADLVRREVSNLDPNLPIAEIQPMHAALGFALLPARMLAGVLAGFGFVALFLAAVGLYGVISYSVSQSLRDIGIRVALGARPADVLALVLRSGMGLTLAGLAIGGTASIFLARLMTSVLYDVVPTDYASYVTAASVLTGAALLASFLPARRATRIDPIVFLKLG